MESNFKISNNIINAKIIDSSASEESNFPFIKYIKYTIKISTKDRDYKIKRRYKNFNDLHGKLENKKLTNLPRLPPKKLFLTEEDQKERQSKLEKYLNSLLCRRDTYKHHEILDFVEMEREHFLMLGENILEEASTGENSPCSKQDKVISFINLKKSNSSSDVQIQENFFYSNFQPTDVKNQRNNNKSRTFLTLSSKKQFEEEMLIREENNDNRTFILSFLKKLNSNIEDKCKIIKEFEDKFNARRKDNPVQRDEVYRLFFGDNDETGYLGGLIFHSGNIEKNQIGAEKCIEFLSKLINYQHNIDCDFFANVLKLAKLSQIKSMRLEEHLLNNKQKVIESCYFITKTILNDEKGILLSNIFKNKQSVVNFESWLNLLS